MYVYMLGSRFVFVQSRMKLGNFDIGLYAPLLVLHPPMTDGHVCVCVCVCVCGPRYCDASLHINPVS